MNNRNLSKPLAIALGAAIAGSLATASVASASPFSLTTLGSAYMYAGEGSCGGAKGAEGKCGGDKAKEGSCGGDKAKEGSCGGDKAKEGSCGGDKAKEGNCGANKAKEGKCGEGKCGGDKKTG